MPDPLEVSPDGDENAHDRLDQSPSLLTDQDPTFRLIEDLQAGRDVEESSRKLVALHQKRVIGFFRRRGFSNDDSNDLTQDVFSRVFHALDTFRRESRFERWLFEIALNIYRNKLRSLSAEKRDGLEVSIGDSHDEDGSASKIDLPSSEPNALDELVAEEQRSALRRELERLPAQMRRCCELRYVQGLKYHEIATVMKISIETVKAHLHQARKRLIDGLGGN